MSNHRISIVDDCATSRSLISEFVQFAGFMNIKTFSDPFEVLSAAQSGDLPAIVVSDFKMPNLDGISLLSSLSSYAFPFSGIIVTSDKESAISHSCFFPVLDKADPKFFQRFTDFMMCFR
jgi:DNA-binding NarL/FixJ family response regulator